MEEIKYLKSGGQSNVPERFLDMDLDIDDETFQNLLKKDMNKDDSYKMKK